MTQYNEERDAERYVDDQPPMEADLHPPVQISERSAESTAIAVTTALGNPKAMEEYKRLYKETGSKGEWELLQNQFMVAKSEQERADVVRRTVMRSEALGLDPTAELQNGEIIQEEVTKGQMALAPVFRDPLGTAYTEKMQNEPRMDALDPEEASLQSGISLQSAMDIQKSQGEQLLREYALEIERRSQDGLEGGSGNEIAAGILASFLPMYDTAIMNKVAYDLNKKLGTDITMGGVGEISQSMREILVDLPFDMKKEFILEMTKAIDESPIGFTDFHNQMLLDVIVNEETLVEGNADEYLWRTLDNLFSVLDVISVGGIARGTVKGYKMYRMKQGLRMLNTPAAKAEAIVNKERQVDSLASILNSTDDAAAETLGVGKVDVVRTQKIGNTAVDDVIEDIPTLLDEDLVRLQELEFRLSQLTDEAAQNGYVPKERVTALEREAQSIRDTWGGTLRPGLSRVSVHENGGGATFKMTLGKNEKYGFGGEKVALTQAQELMDLGYQKVRILVNDGDKVRGYMTPTELASELAGRKSKKGNFYVQFDQDYFFRPTDKGLFGGAPVVSPSWIGRAGRWLLSPSSQFSPELYHGYLSATLNERAIVGTLDSIVAPIYELPRSSRRTVDSMYEFTEKFALENKGKRPTHAQLREAFPDSNPNEWRAMGLVQKYYDTVYDIQNQRLFKDMKSRGFTTLYDTNGKGASYHGKNLTTTGEVFAGGRSGKIGVLDPETNKLVYLNKSQVDKIMEKGASIMKTDDAIKVDGRKSTHFILNDPLHKNWKITKLSQRPLKYVEGYYPRIYQDNYYIKKIIKNAETDGVKGSREEYVTVVGTEKEAKHLLEKMRRKYADDATLEFEYVPDQRLSTKDRTAMDRQRLMTEGRLFFDDRAPQRLMDVQGQPADVVSPINMLQRTSNMVGNQVAVDDLSKAYKNSWLQRYGEIFDLDIDKLHSSAVAAELSKVAESGTKAERRIANEALAYWDYIRLMDGNTAEGSKWFRRRAIVASEWLSEKMSGVKGANKASQWLYRNAHKAAPVEQMKHMAFIDFMVTRPARQLVLQGTQHMFLQALDPLYVGRWQKDSFFLLSNMKKESAALMGMSKKDIVKMTKRNAAAMGYTTDEMAILSREFSNSGVVQAVNIHSYAGDMAKAGKVLPSSKAGDVAQTAGRTMSAAPVREFMQSKGFDLGEQFNVTASYLMALRMWRKEHKAIKSLTQINPQQWQEISVRASDYSLAMNRANSNKYQYGLFSLPTQFLQFSHKVALTMLRGGIPIPGVKYVPGLKQVDLAMQAAGNKAFTPKQARMLIGGQIVMFGGAGFGVKPEVESLLQRYNVEQYVGTEIADIMAGGILDWMLDKSLQGLTGDETLDIAFDTALAPGANTINIIRDFVDLAVETPIVETFFGASGATMSRVYEAVQMVNHVVLRDEAIDDTTRAVRVLETIAAGGLSGYNDFAKAKAGRNLGHLIASDGRYNGSQQTWASLVAKGAFGFNTEEGATSYDNFMELRDTEKGIQDTVREYHKRIHKYMTTYYKGEYSAEQIKMMIGAERYLLETILTDEDWLYGMEFFQELEGEFELERDSISQLITDAVTKGVPISDYLQFQIDKMEIPDEDKQALHQLINEQMLDIKQMKPDMIELLNEEQ